MMYQTLHFDRTRPVDLICMGRVAVDLYAEQIGCSLADASSFKKYLGGCAGNIAVGIARLGLNSMMFSVIGQDEMGAFLKKELQAEGVNTDLVYETKNHLTGLVLLGVKPPHDFPLMFYRNECADMQLKADHINEADLKKAKALLITGTGFSTPEMRETSKEVVRLARTTETAVILDLDFRPVLWGLTALGNGETRYCSDSRVSQIYQQFLSQCDLIVGTEEEVCIAGGSEDLNSSLSNLRQFTDSPIVIKSGEQGAQVSFSGMQDRLKTKPFPVDVLNVLGAGDAFMAGLLSGLLQGKPWVTAMNYANASGALVVTRHACAAAIPYMDELEYFIKHYDDQPRIWNSPYLAQLHQKKNAGMNAPPPLTSSGKTSGSPVLKKQHRGFDTGLNSIISMQDSEPDMGMNFYSLKLDKGQTFTFNLNYEFAALLMTGRVLFHYSNQSTEAARYDYFSQAPFVLHCPSGQIASVQALSDCEILLIETENERHFTPLLFNKFNMLELDNRGKDILDDTSYRIVRTVFDKRNRPDSNLVLGEIITLQGRWSSYPSHYHNQPEVYHYRFSEPRGFAFGEKGKEVLRIEHYDTYSIAQSQEHAHCTAPGYALYTLWFIRHLENNPYYSPTFLKEHEWTRTTKANLRTWKQHSPEGVL